MKREFDKGLTLLPIYALSSMPNTIEEPIFGNSDFQVARGSTRPDPPCLTSTYLPGTVVAAVVCCSSRFHLPGYLPRACSLLLDA